MLESHLRQAQPDSLRAVDPRNLYLQSVWVFPMPPTPVLCNSLLGSKVLLPPVQGSAT